MADDKDSLTVRILQDIREEVRGTNQRLGRVEVRLDSIEVRLDSMDDRFDAMDRRFDAMDGRLDSMDGRLGRVETELHDFRVETRASFAGVLHVIAAGDR